MNTENLVDIWKSQMAFSIKETVCSSCQGDAKIAGWQVGTTGYVDCVQCKGKGVIKVLVPKEE